MLVGSKVARLNTTKSKYTKKDRHSTVHPSAGTRDMDATPPKVSFYKDLTQGTPSSPVCFLPPSIIVSPAQRAVLTRVLRSARRVLGPSPPPEHYHLSSEGSSHLWLLAEPPPSPYLTPQPGSSP